MRENHRLEKVSVLLGLFQEGDSFIPVQMEVKHASDGNRLYMTVAMTKIEAGVLGSGDTVSGTFRSLIPTSEFNIADFFMNVNPADRSFLNMRTDPS